MAAKYETTVGGRGGPTDGKLNVTIVGEVRVDAAVGLHPGETSVTVKVAPAVRTQGLGGVAAESLVHKARAVRPYSNATRGDIDVAVRVTANGPSRA